MEINQIIDDLSIVDSHYDEASFKDSLLRDANILKVIEELQLDEETIDNNLVVLMQYLRIIKKDPTLPKGMILDNYDAKLVCEEGVLHLDYQKKEALLLKEQKLAHLKNFLINHLSERLSMVSADDLKFDHYKEWADIKDIIRMRIDDKKGYFLHGNVGVGKTFLLVAKANQFASDGHSVCFVNVNRLLSEIKQSFNTSSDTLSVMLNKMKACDFLVLDDIGAESNTSWSRDEILFQVLDARMEQQKLTCFTSNLNREDLMTHFSVTNQLKDEIKAVRLMERIDVLSDFVLIVSKRGSLRKA